MKLPFVSRERYDEKCTELAALKMKYEALTAEREHAKRTPKPPSPQRDPMVDKLAADLENVLPDKAAARAEAERIKREVLGGSL